MGVGFLADAVELQVGDAEAGLARLARERGILREADAVGRRLHAEVADLPRVATESRKIGEMVGSPPENCTVICRRGLMLIASSRSCFTSSSVSSWT